VEQDEVDDVAEARAVGQVPGDAGEQQRARAEHAVVLPRRAEEVGEDGDRRRAGQRDQQPAARRAALLKLPEGDAGILRVGQIEEARHDRHVPPQTQAAHRPRLRGLIDEVDAERRQQVGRAPAQAVERLDRIAPGTRPPRSPAARRRAVRAHDDAPSASISASASMQRSQTVG
jgi:hypothetical protein